MELLSGDKALTRARELIAAAPLIAVEIDPRARDTCRLQLLGLASAERAVLIDAQNTPGLGTLFEDNRPFAAYDAKTVHRALLATTGAGPRRWACVRVSELLLLGGRTGALDLESIATKYGLPAPPSVAAGLAQLGAHAQALHAIVDAQIPCIRADGMTSVSKLEAAAVAPIAAMEHRGMPFDAAMWRRLDAEAAAERQELRQELGLVLAQGRRDLLGAPALNLDSEQALRAALAALGHAVPNTRRETLLALPPPLGPLLARYRELAKLVGAYGQAFLEHVAADGRLHPTFEQIGASTGRLSCHSPNLQSIVKDAPHRACFRVEPDRRLVIGDYATCELRILTEMSGDPVFAEAFARGEDLHARVASRVFGRPVSKTENSELRDRAKAVNFGLCYGMGAGGLARAIGVDLKHAEELLARYFRSFPKIRGFLESSAHAALERGYAMTLAGRRLYLDAGEDRATRGQAERVAKNMPIQGTSADITKIALARLHAALQGWAESGDRVGRDACLVNTVHDEIVVECAAARAEDVSAIVEREMRLAGEEVLAHVPVKIDVAVSDHWQK